VIIMATTAYIVEDDAHSLLAISSLLDELGIHYKRNTTGAGVVQQIGAMAPKPDFVLLDLDLPDGDAFAICATLTSEPGSHIPIIALTDRCTDDLKGRMQASGFAGLVHKPLPRRCFLDYVQRILSGENLVDSPLTCDS
jgi:CheY-like chemotaxis protein